MSNVVALASRELASLTPEQVYDAWTRPELLGKWMAHHLRIQDQGAQVTRIETEPVVGGKFVFADSREGSEAWGYYKVLERPGRIAFSWFVSPEEEEEDNSLVTIEIAARGEGSTVTISHEMGAEWAEYIEPTARAWASMLEAIEASLGRD